ncbi:hypothetical protein CHS0354_007695 [Potamilus streckersoni]|uniref:Uncharacterized protein n=1 Tax=Potamilus streckersoni TaxID=2493646 RepID=A0AAE0SGY2_9BIVA|nr:hypothetical protein CHS0354_007695 [Potamilus streckersoni]
MLDFVNINFKLDFTQWKGSRTPIATFPAPSSTPTIQMPIKPTPAHTKLFRAAHKAKHPIHKCHAKSVVFPLLALLPSLAITAKAILNPVKRPLVWWCYHCGQQGWSPENPRGNERGRLLPVIKWSRPPACAAAAVVRALSNFGLTRLLKHLTGVRDVLQRSVNDASIANLSTSQDRKLH